MSMTQVIVHQILSQIETLDTEELRQLQQSIQSRLTQHQTAQQASFHQTLLASGLTQPQYQTAQQADFLQTLLGSGLTYQIKFPSHEFIERRLVEIQGKPLSETILEERR
jgi:hypothetical protein